MTALILDLVEIMILSTTKGYLGSGRRLNQLGHEADDSPLSAADIRMSGAVLQDLRHEQNKFTLL